MSIFIVPGTRDAVLAFISEKLMSAMKHPSVISEASFYEIGREVPYIAETLERSFESGPLSFNAPTFIFTEALAVTDPVVDKMHPERAQNVADQMLLSLFSKGSFPRVYPEQTSIQLAQKMYKLASLKHPTEPLRPTFEVLSLNFPVWAKALPHVRKQMSLVISP